jgi:hypothetical protein
VDALKAAGQFCKADMDRLERQIRINVLLELVAELYDANLSDVISVKEWLEAKAEMLRTGHLTLVQELPPYQNDQFP